MYRAVISMHPCHGLALPLVSAVVVCSAELHTFQYLLVFSRVSFVSVSPLPLSSADSINKTFSGGNPGIDRAI